MTGIKIVNGLRGSDPRKSPRLHSWRQPRESVVAGLIGEQALRSTLQFSVGQGKAIPISGLPQVYAYQGSLVATKLGEGYSYGRAILELLKPDHTAFGTGGFADLGDLLAKASVSANNELRPFSKVGPTGVVGVAADLWRTTGLPAAGAVGAALASGTNCDRTTTGALGQRNPDSGYTKHLVGCTAQGSVNGNVIAIIDRIWHGAPAMASTGAQTVTMTPTRYAGTGASGSSRGSVLSMVVGGTNLAATAHNNTFTYVDDNGNTAEATTAQTGRSGATTDTFDHAVGANQFAVLNSPDVGVSDFTSYQCSASVATGVMNVILYQTLMIVPIGLAYAGAMIDGINSDVNLEEVLTDACLCFIELAKPATTATTYSGLVRMIQGNAA